MHVSAVVRTELTLLNDRNNNKQIFINLATIKQPEKNHFQNDITIIRNSYLDIDFINFLYFKSAQHKNEYIEKVKTVLDKTIGNGKIERPKVANYINQNDNDIPFLLDAIKFDEYNGGHKLDKYYTALNVCRFNLHEKIEAQFFEFDFEETVAEKAFKSDHRNYARIETLFLFGKAFLIANNATKANYYFDIIFNDTYDLSGDTVSKFFRQIGYNYLECGNKSAALKWYKKGLQLNSKLGVKKQVANLEKELNGS